MNWLDLWPIVAFVIIQGIAVVTALNKQAANAAVNASRLSQLEIKVVTLETDHSGFRRDVNDIRVTLGRIEERLIAWHERNK